MIIDIETTEMKVGAMITIGTATIAMTERTIDMDTTEMLIITEIAGAVIATLHRLGTMIETFRLMEVGVVVQVDDGSRKNGIGRHDDTTTTNQTTRIAGENGIEARIKIAEERKIRGGIAVIALDHLVVHHS